MQFEYTVEELKELLSPLSEKGSFSGSIKGVASLEKAQAGDLSFLGNKKYRAEVEKSAASILFLPEDYNTPPKEGQLFLFFKNPSFALAKLCRDIEKKLFPMPPAGIHKTAYIAPSAKIDPSACIGPFCCVGDNSIVEANTWLKSHVALGNFAKVGKDTTLMPHVSIYDYCEVGNNVLLHSGVVVGSDGFGFETVNGIHEKVPQIGRVIIEDDVEIGANTTIDRARFEITRIGAGTKIDNLVQVAHNVQIGKGCLLAAQAGISGSTILEDYVVLAGQAGLAGHLNIGAQAIIGAQAGVNHDIEAKTLVRGTPALPYMQAQRIDVIKRKLPEFFKRFQNLEKKLSD